MKNRLKTIGIKTKLFLSKPGIASALALVLTLTFIVAGSVTTALAGNGLADMKTGDLIKYILEIYRKWVIPFAIVTAILWALTKDEKRKELYKRALIAMAVVYVISFVIGTILETIDTAASKLEGNAGGFGIDEWKQKE